MKMINNLHKIKPLLKIGESYGLKIGVEPEVVLAGFLTKLWSPPDNYNRLKALTNFLCDKDDERSREIKTKLKFKNKKNEEMFKQFLREKLWLNSHNIIDSLKKDEVFGEKSIAELGTKHYKKIMYSPLNKYLLKSPPAQQELGAVLYRGLIASVSDLKLKQIKEKIDKLHQKEEIEERILHQIMPINDFSDEVDVIKEDSEETIDFSMYKDLFEQLAIDINSLLSINIDTIAKPKLLNFLEKLLNFYANMYYLSIICELKAEERPLITPLCGENSNSQGQDISINCLNEYRQKGIRFWRSYIRTNVEKNIDILNLRGKSVEEIIDSFIEEDQKNKSIFGFPIQNEVKKTAIYAKMKTAIKDICTQYESSDYDSVYLFTEGFLQYNLRSSRTIAKIRILDYQGPGAGIVAPKGKKWKHFHLSIDLLELLVICFINNTNNIQMNNTLRTFVSFLKDKYGIIIDDDSKVRELLDHQKLPIPYFSQLDKLEQMLEQLNMLTTLSDTTKKLKCSYSINKIGLR